MKEIIERLSDNLHRDADQIVLNEQASGLSREEQKTLVNELYEDITSNYPNQTKTYTAYCYKVRLYEHLLSCLDKE